MSHFDSPAEAPALAFGCQHRVEKTKAKLARDRENRHIDPGHPTKLKLKTQKTTSAKRAIFYVIGGPAAAPAAVLARQFMTYNDLLSGVGDGAALEEAQLLMYPFGGSQERIERGSQSPRATSKSAAKGLHMSYAAHRESAR